MARRVWIDQTPIRWGLQKMELANKRHVGVNPRALVKKGGLVSYLGVFLDVTAIILICPSKYFKRCVGGWVTWRERERKCSGDEAHTVGKMLIEGEGEQRKQTMEIMQELILCDTS